MARPGPKKRPKALTDLLGNPGHRTKGHVITPEIIKTPTCPKFLYKHPIAQAEYNRLAPELSELGLLTELDKATFSMLCLAYSNFRTYQETLEEDGETIKTPQGEKASPYVAMRDRAFAQFCSLCREFGLTPAARASINVNPGYQKTPSLAEWQKSYAELPEGPDGASE